MEQFRRDAAHPCYYFGRQCDADRAEVVDLASVEPPVPNTGIPLFRKYKLVPVLFAFTSPECSLPPMKGTGRTRAMTVRLLVVDDEPDAEDLFRQQFRREIREGLYTLDFALSAMAALAILDEAIGEETILLVSDINMPGMSGLDLIPEVKVRRPDLPVFMISDYGDAERVKSTSSPTRCVSTPASPAASIRFPSILSPP